MATPNRQRGLLKVATELQSQGSVDRTGVAGGLATVASAFGQTANQIGAIADHAAAKEGVEAGRLAGLDPEFRPTRSLTIRGEAYDKAGLEIYGARAKQGFADDLAAAYDAHSGDPQALSEALTAKRNSWLAESLPELRPELELMYEKAQLSYMRQAARVQAARVDAEHRATLESEIALAVKETQQQAYALGLDETAAQANASNVAELARIAGRRGLDGNPLLTPNARRDLIAKATAEANDAALMGAFDRTPGLEAKAAFIEKFKDDFGKSEGLAKSYSFDDFQRLTGKMESGLSKEVTARNALVRQAGQEIRTVASRAEKGFPVPAEEMATIEAKVAAANDAETAEAFRNAKGILELQETARTWSPAQLDQVIAAGRARMQKDGASEDQVARLGLLESLQGEMRKELKSDPLGWATRVGVLDVAPLDFSDADKAAASIRTRIAQAEEVGDRYGQQTVFLRPDEKRQISTIAAEGGEQTLMVAQTIAASAGEKTPAIMAELFDDAPAIAMIGGLVAEVGPVTAARDAADGLALIRSEGFKGLAPAKTQSRESAVDVLGDALADMPKAETAAVTLANAIYEIRARRQGVTEFDEDLWKQGLREALGERTIGGEVYGGVVENDLSGWHSEPKILLPPFLRQDGWREVIDMLQPEDLTAAGLGQPVGDNGKPIPMERLKAATVIQQASGRYALALGDPSIPGAEGFARMRGPAGLTTFILDLNALEPQLSKRRPDLFLGGAANPQPTNDATTVAP